MYTPLVSAVRKQKQEVLYGLKARLVYIESFRPSQVCIVSLSLSLSSSPPPNKTIDWTSLRVSVAQPPER